MIKGRKLSFTKNDKPDSSDKETNVTTKKFLELTSNELQKNETKEQRNSDTSIVELAYKLPKDMLRSEHNRLDGFLVVCARNFKKNKRKTESQEFILALHRELEKK